MILVGLVALIAVTILAARDEQGGFGNTGRAMAVGVIGTFVIGWLVTGDPMGLLNVIDPSENCNYRC